MINLAESRSSFRMAVYLLLIKFVINLTDCKKMEWGMRSLVEEQKTAIM